MHLRSTLAVRRLGVAVTALALGLGMSTPSSGAPAKDKATDCIDYGDVTTAPAGTIPRDDLHVVHKDPLAAAMKSTCRWVCWSVNKRSGKRHQAVTPRDFPRARS